MHVCKNKFLLLFPTIFLISCSKGNDNEPDKKDSTSRSGKNKKTKQKTEFEFKQEAQDMIVDISTSNEVKTIFDKDEYDYILTLLAIINRNFQNAEQNRQYINYELFVQRCKAMLIPESRKNFLKNLYFLAKSFNIEDKLCDEIWTMFPVEDLIIKFEKILGNDFVDFCLSFLKNEQLMLLSFKHHRFTNGRIELGKFKLNKLGTNVNSEGELQITETDLKNTLFYQVFNDIFKPGTNENKKLKRILTDFKKVNDNDKKTLRNLASSIVTLFKNQAKLRQKNNS